MKKTPIIAILLVSQLTFSSDYFQNTLNTIKQEINTTQGNILIQEHELEVLLDLFENAKVKREQAYQQYKQGLISVQQLNEKTKIQNDLLSQIHETKRFISKFENMIKEKEAQIDEVVKEHTIKQITETEAITTKRNEVLHKINTSKSIRISSENCKMADELRSSLPDFSDPNYKSIVSQMREYSKLCEIGVYTEGYSVVGFNYEERMNPSDYQSPTRSVRVTFANRNTKDIRFQITDDSKLSGKMSHDLLETTVYFFPRLNLPSVEIIETDDGQIRRYKLNTGETFDVDAITKKTIGGVLDFDPIDLTPSRHERKFAGINYSGNGIMVRADRRAGTPSLNYDTAFNSNERNTEATVTHKDKTCYIKKKHIWDTPHLKDSRPTIKHEDDQALLKTINKYCKWNLKMEDII